MHKGKHVMPYLHRLSTQSIYYPFVMSYHKGGGTSDCDFSVLNSVEPLNFSSVFFRADYDFQNSVLKVLRAAGYNTYAFHGNTGQCWNRKVAFPKMGYQLFYDQEAMALPSAGWGAPDKEVFDYVLQALPKKRQPFFAHVITMSSHFPYNSVAQYYEDTRFNDIPAKEARSYFNSMSYVDKALEGFVESLRQMDNTTIIIYGDHAASRMVGQHFTAAKFSIRTNVLEFVPLLIITPAGTIYRERQHIATFLDVAPTVLDIAGIGCTYATNGQSLLSPPIKDSEIPLRGSLYLRSYLMNKCRSMDWSNVWSIEEPQRSRSSMPGSTRISR
jgi:phosphoglycerol transferase MdoB-like AlkP superfamily enzyme